MACPVNTQIILLRPPIPVLLGALIALNGPVQFAPCESLTPRGQLSVSAYQSGLSGRMTGERDSWSSFWAIRSDESAIAVWIGARLAGTKLTLLSSRSTTSWTADSKYLFPAELFFHGVNTYRSAAGPETSELIVTSCSLPGISP